MKYIPGTEFTIKKKARDFQAGEVYRIHHISPVEDGVEYTFLTNSGKVSMQFESIGIAESLINKYGGV
jgi:hypothetical protein